MMKYITLLFLGLLSTLLLYSCRAYKETKQLNQYLLQVVNDTNFYEVPALEITDESIYFVLDSAISATERCKYFDDRVKYHYGFYITSTIDENGKTIYFVSSLESVSATIGVLYGFIAGGSKITRGVFYYKNYLFSLTLNEYIKNKKDYFDFYKKKGCNYRIKATELPNSNVISSNLWFKKEKDRYVITENNICGYVIYAEW